MSFEKTVEALIAATKPVVVAPLLKFETVKTEAFAGGIKVPVEITEKQLRDSVRAAAIAHVQRGQTFAAFAKLSPIERRKASALVAAGQRGGSVTAHFKSLTPGSLKGAAGTAEQLKKGLALAKTQRVKLDAATW